MVFVVLGKIVPEYLGVSDDEVEKLGISHYGLVDRIDATLVPQALEEIPVGQWEGVKILPASVVRIQLGAGRG